MKKIYWILVVTGVLIVVFVMMLRLGGEDSWIKDSRGVYVKHGNPSEIPDYVLEQQQAIDCAMDKFEDFIGEKDSQCLGTCGDYVVDIVHVPRDDEDNKIENQCEDYRQGLVNHFIELDKDGNIVRIV